MSENVKKAYAVVVYEQISDETKLKNYMDIAPKTFGKFGAKFLTRGYPAVIKENGKNELLSLSFQALQGPKSFTTARNM